jgi:nucleoside-diphosphate-sugar epimerase
MNFVLGASGQIGTAILENLKACKVKVVPRSQYESWNTFDHISKFVDMHKINSGDTFYICSGITNPAANSSQIDLQNFQIPLAILKNSLDRQFQVVTFGSVQENSNLSNPYLDSKRLFLKQALEIETCQNHRHFQLNTVYGIHKPKSYMLLGEILSAIQNQSPLYMTSGNQIREYWHADDIAKCVTSDSLKTPTARVVSVSSGHPIRIKDLATRVFEHFSMEDYLYLDAIPNDPNESYNVNMINQINGFEGNMRDPFGGVISYLENWLNGGKA